MEASTKSRSWSLQKSWSSEPLPMTSWKSSTLSKDSEKLSKAVGLLKTQSCICNKCTNRLVIVVDGIGRCIGNGSTTSAQVNSESKVVRLISPSLGSSRLSHSACKRPKVRQRPRSGHDASKVRVKSFMRQDSESQSQTEKANMFWSLRSGGDSRWEWTADGKHSLWFLCLYLT